MKLAAFNWEQPQLALCYLNNLRSAFPVDLPAILRPALLAIFLLLPLEIACQSPNNLANLYRNPLVLFTLMVSTPIDLINLTPGCIRYPWGFVWRVYLLCQSTVLTAFLNLTSSLHIPL